MYRYRRGSSRREALGQLLGEGPMTFYATFKRYKTYTIPEFGKTETRGWWVLLTTVTDEDCRLLTDHLWARLPASSRYCSWALQPRTVLQLRATVGEYDTRRYDFSLCKSVGLTDYCFEKIYDYEPVKYYPVITPQFEREAALFFDRLLKRPDLLKKWSGRRFSCTGLPKMLLPAEYPLYPKL